MWLGKKYLLLQFLIFPVCSLLCCLACIFLRCQACSDVLCCSTVFYFVLLRQEDTKRLLSVYNREKKDDEVLVPHHDAWICFCYKCNFFVFLVMQTLMHYL